MGGGHPVRESRAASCSLHTPSKGTHNPPPPPRKPGSLFLSLGPLFPQSQSRKAGSSWLRGAELLLQGSSCHPALPHLPGQTGLQSQR